MTSLRAVVSTLSLGLTALALVACSQARTRELCFVLDPSASHTLTVTCEASATGKCHFVFAGNDHPVEASIPVGSRVSIAANDPPTEYCAGMHKLRPETCIKSQLDHQRITVDERFAASTVSD